MKGIFGTNGASYPSGSAYYPYANTTLIPFNRHASSYPQYPAYSRNPQQPPYPQNSQNYYYPNYVSNSNWTQYPNSWPSFSSSYSWGSPQVLLPSRGLESVLIAILVLVVLDLIFVRPLKFQ
jgi:hypothetical protein